VITTFSDKWSPRTGLHSAPPTKSAKTQSGETSQPRETREAWAYTRGIILGVLDKFPDALQAVRDAIAEASRTCPRELLHEPA
jgi:hypothetical protein